jgi:hypothetical protein
MADVVKIIRTGGGGKAKANDRLEKLERQLLDYARKIAERNR